MVQVYANGDNQIDGSQADRANKADLTQPDQEAPGKDPSCRNLLDSNIEAAADGAPSARRRERASPSHLASRDSADPIQDLYALDSKI